VPAAAAFALLGGVDPELGALDWPAATSVELVTLVLDDARLDAAPRGTGMLVAADVPASTVTAKAITHATAKWAWLAEAAGPGRHVLRLSYGRAGGEGAVTSLDDARLRELAVRDAGRLLNIPLDASTVAGFARTRWTNALPFAAIGQRDRIRALRERVSAFEGLDIAGTWLAGTGLASVVPDARSAATRLRGLRWRKLTGT
jgi:oxygen-dependent protoporphyrinogen oxidase